VLVVRKGNLKPCNTIALFIKVHLKDPPSKSKKCQESHRISVCKLRITDLDKCIIIIL